MEAKRTMLGLLAAATLAAATPAVTACTGGPAGGPTACTQIGCTDGVTVDASAVQLPERGRVEVCADGVCQDFRLRADAPEPLLSVTREPGTWEPGEEVRVTVRVTDRRGDVLLDAREQVRLERSQPNGPSCPPVCASGQLTLEDRPE